MNTRGLKAACLAVGLATAWGVQANAQLDEIQLTITPSNNLSHVYFLYGSNGSSFYANVTALALPDVEGGTTATNVFYVPDLTLLGYAVVGLYDEANQGVAIDFGPYYADNYVIGHTNWSGVFSTPESAIATALESNDVAAITAFAEGASIGENVNVPSVLVDFSNATDGGSALAEIIPEPSSFLLAVFGVLLILGIGAGRARPMCLRPAKIRDP